MLCEADELSGGEKSTGVVSVEEFVYTYKWYLSRADGFHTVVLGIRERAQLFLSLNNVHTKSYQNYREELQDSLHHCCSNIRN